MDTRLKISYHQKQTPPRFIELEKELKPIAGDIAFRWSHKGVPHLLVELGKGIVYSLCYFKGDKIWRVFYPYGNGNQQKQDFNSVEEMIKFLKKHKPRRIEDGTDKD